VTRRCRVTTSETRPVPANVGTSNAMKINKRQPVRSPLGPFQIECKDGARSGMSSAGITFLTSTPALVYADSLLDETCGTVTPD
jgi:hypothetical protein